MNRRVPTSVALDCEFVKTRGRVMVSAIAFVPFLSLIPPKLSDSAHDAHGTTAIAGGRLEPEQPARRTMGVSGNSAVLSVEPGEVMRHADVLPCGHCLKPLFRREPEADIGLLQPSIKIQRYLRAEDTMKDIEGAPPSPQTGAGLDMLCPHSIPNVRRVDESSLLALHVAPVDSPEFRRAAASIDHLRIYGRGSRRRWAISLLAKQHPQLLHDILRQNFATADDWRLWLLACGDAVEAELRKVAEEHRRISVTQSERGEVNPEEGAARKTGGVKYKECKKLEELPHELSRMWSSFMSTQNNGGGVKFYTYGNMDAKAIQNSLQLRAVTRGRDTESHEESEGLGKCDLLKSLREAKVVDLTRHPLFVASGFCTSPRAPPPLTEALKRAAVVDVAAKRLLESNSLHDPLWDAKALACIAVACGVPR